MKVLPARWAPCVTLERRVSPERGYFWYCHVLFQAASASQFTDVNCQVEVVDQWLLVALFKGIRAAKREKNRIEKESAPIRQKFGWN